VIDVARRLGPARGRTVATAAIAGAALLYVSLVDPHRARLLSPRCPVKQLTGLDCPACGGMRMAYDVVHGDARAALHDNPFLLVCAPLLGALLWRGIVAEPDSDAVPASLAYGLGLAALAWMAVRNAPGWPLRPTLRG
jgi:hypothetical protein